MGIRVSVESKRGCGYRKGGGIYLVSDAPATRCGKLPIPLEACCTCGQGIKPARGWTWVDGDKLTEGALCSFASRLTGCGGCALAQPLGKCGLIWVGEAFYKTPQEWNSEALQMGVSRRISAVPKGFKVGETRVLMAHRKAIPTMVEREETEEEFAEYMATGKAVAGATREFPNVRGTVMETNYTPGIFTSFIPLRLEYVVKGTETDEEIAALERRGFSLVKVIRDVDYHEPTLPIQEEAAS